MQLRLQLPSGVIYVTNSEKEELILRCEQLEAENERLRGQLKASEKPEADDSAHTRYNRLLLENSPNMVAMLDDNMRLVFASKTVAAFTGGVSPDFLTNGDFCSLVRRYLSPPVADILITHVLRVLSEENKDAPEQPFAFYSEETKRSYEVRIVRCKDKTDDKTRGVLLVVRDQTDEMNAIRAAEEASRAKSDFLATMSHEIRTPMNAIIGLQDAVMSEPLTERQKGFLRNMKSSSKNLLAIINDILDFSKIEAGKMTFEETSFSLKTFLTSVYDVTAMTARQKHLVCRPEFSDELPDFVRADENKLRQILNNLLSNAIKYTPGGFIEFIADVCHVGEKDPSGGVLTEEALRFVVRDTGIGIKREDVLRLFSPFEQLDNRRNKNVAGTGLGLVITHRMCEAMGGHIFVESVYNEGSTFTVLLPLTISEAAGDAFADDGALLSEPFTAPKAKVLVVDDVDVNLIVAEAVLSDYEIEPDSALSGGEAVRMAREKRYDMIFMDQMMPVMDGFEATRRIRALGGHNAGIPIVALTASVMAEAQRRLLEAGCNDLLLKPIETSMMTRCLRKWLAKELIVET